MNKVILMGYLGDEAKHKVVGDKSCVSFSLATSEWSTKENAYIPTWHRVIVWGKVDQKFDKLKKGALVLIEDGKYIGRSYDHNGEKKYVMEVISWKTPVVVKESATQEKPAAAVSDGFDMPF